MDIPIIGSTIKAIKGRYTDAYDRQTGVVKEIKHLGDTPIVMAEFQDRGMPATIAVDEWEIVGESEPTPDEVIADLTQQLYDTCKLYDDARARLSASQNYYRNDMGHFERVMREQKDKHGWCDEGANAVIDALVEGFIGGWEIERYEDEHEVEVEINCEGLVVQHTVSLMATSQEEANDRVLDDPDAYFDPIQVIREYIDYGYPSIEVNLA